MVKKEVEQQHVPNRFIRELVAIKEEVRNDVVGPVVASFGFIIALIWRDAIQVGIHQFLNRYGLNGDSFLYQSLSASIVTIFVIIVMVIVTKLGRKKKKTRIEEAVQRARNREMLSDLKEKEK